MQNAFIIDGVRTGIGKFGGTLAKVRTDDLIAETIKALVNKYPQINWTEVEDVIIGCSNQAGEDNRNIARMALLLAGLPYTVPGQTINRLCASGLTSVMEGARTIMLGDANLIIAGGVENMSRGPYVISKANDPYDRTQQMYDSSFGWRFINPKMKELYGTDSMGETAENVAEMLNISREDQDKFALWSQQKAAKSQQNGRFKKEIFPLTIPQKKDEPIVFDTDEFMKPNTTLDVLAKLKPAFRKNGSVTAGNSSGINDGAAALLLASENTIKKYNLKPLARVVTGAVVGVEPRIMGLGPVDAVNKLLTKTKLQLKDIDIIELNEAFAAQSLGCIRQWKLEDNDPRINPNGGAIALGHPLGMSGARIALTAAIELQEQKKKYAIATMCVGVGQGYAILLERV